MAPEFEEEKYFQVSIDELLAGKRVRFPLFIYFQDNNHLLLRYRAGDDITHRELTRYRELGLKQFWCSKENEREFAEIGTVCAPGSSDIVVPGITESEKKATLQELADEMISTLLAIETKTITGRDALLRCKRFTDDIVSAAVRSHAMSHLYEELRSVQALELGHSVVASIYAVLFAMALGYTDQEALADLAFSAMLHDIGYILIDPVLFTIPESQYTDKQRAEFRDHVDLGLKILDGQGVQLTPNVRRIISEHHEYTDGSGYPKGLRGNQIHECSQILGIADQVDEFMSGRTDGVMRDPAESLAHFRALAQGPFSTRYSPELFRKIVKSIDRGKIGIESRNHA